MLEITLLLGIVAVVTLIGWWVHPSRLHASLTPDQHRRVKFWFVSAESVMSSRSRAGWRQLSGFSSSNSRFHRFRRVLPPGGEEPIPLLRESCRPINRRYSAPFAFEAQEVR